MLDRFLAPKPRLLVVDDDPAMCAYVADILQRHHLNASYAWRIEDALALLEAGERFTLAVVDVVMPGMSGEQFVRILRTYDPDIKVLFVTGSSAAADADGPRWSHAEASLHKPFREHTLLDAVSFMLNRRRARRSSDAYGGRIAAT